MKQTGSARRHPLSALKGSAREAACEAIDARLARQLVPGALAYPVAGALLLGLLPAGPVGSVVVAYLVLAVALVVPRTVLAFAFRRRFLRRREGWRFAVLALTAGLVSAWGALAYQVVEAEGASPAGSVCLLVSATLVAGIYAVFPAYLLFAWCCYLALLLPPALALLLRPGESPLALPIAVAAFGLFYTVQTRTRFREVWDHTISTVRLSASVAQLERLNHELQLKREQAVSAVATRTRFIANTSHELRTPLHGILGNAELLLAGSLAERERKLARAIFDAGRSLLRLVDDVLELARVEAGQVRIEVEAEDPRRIAQAVGDTVRGMAHSQGLAVELHLDRSIPAHVMIDGERFRQILLNLVGNAVKFTERGEVRINLTYRAESDPPCLETAVTDTGPGIPSGQEQAIFEDFVQLDSGADRRFAGSGLGLPICKRLVEAMKGEIGVEPAPGGGSTFWFSIPARPTSAVDQRSRTSGRITGARERDGQAARVLVVDDNEPNRQLAVEQVRHLGHDADAVADGEAALEALDGFAYDLVLLDCQMPGLDGYEVARRIRAQRDNVNHLIPIVAVTANAMPEERRRCLQAGMDDYVCKPLNLKTLERVIDVWIAGGAEDAEEAAAGEGDRPGAADGPIEAARLRELQFLRDRLGPAAIDALLAAFEDDYASARDAYGTARAADDRPAVAAACRRLDRLFRDIGLEGARRALDPARTEAGPLPPVPAFDRPTQEGLRSLRATLARTASSDQVVNSARS